MKKCFKCHKIKPVDEFYGRPEKLSSSCKECIKSYGKVYKKLPQNVIKIRERNKIYRKKIVDYIKNIKNKPCLDCNKFYPPCVMEFDHVTGLKRERLSRMASFTLQAVKNEIEKCELVCANCHRVRTQNRLDKKKCQTI